MARRRGCQKRSGLSCVMCQQLVSASFRIVPQAPRGFMFPLARGLGGDRAGAGPLESRNVWRSVGQALPPPSPAGVLRGTRYEQRRWTWSSSGLLTGAMGHAENFPGAALLWGWGGAFVGPPAPWTL